MVCYNRIKKADREREIADRKAEIAAIDAGQWPRDIDDEFRWVANRGFADAYARNLCVAEVAYLEAIPARVASGELTGWEV